jgi:hypothetical protein
MSYWKSYERVVLGAILALSFSTTLRAQEQQPPVENAQLQTPGYNAVASSSTTIPASRTADRWRLLSLSYLWFPGLHGSLTHRAESGMRPAHLTLLPVGAAVLPS